LKRSRLATVWVLLGSLIFPNGPVTEPATKTDAEDAENVPFAETGQRETFFSTSTGTSGARQLT